MENLSFKDKMLELLSATGYSLHLKPEQLTSLDNQDDLKEFTDWFSNLSYENCVTSEELEDFEQLADNGDVSYGKDLEEALQSYHELPVDTLCKHGESSSKIKMDELAHLKDQRDLKRNLLSTVNSSISSLNDDKCKVYSELQRAKYEKEEVLKSILTQAKVYNQKLTDAKSILDKLFVKFLELDQKDELHPDEETVMSMLSNINEEFNSDKANTSITSTISIASTTSTRSLLSACSSDKGSNYAFLCLLPFDKIIKMNKQFNSMLDHILQISIPNIESSDAEVDAESELLGIMTRLIIQKQSLIEKEVLLTGIRMAKERIKEFYTQVQNNECRPTQSTLRSKIVELDLETNDLDNSTTNMCDIYEACSKWGEFQTLQPTITKLTERLEKNEYLMSEMKEMKDQIQIMMTANLTLCQYLSLESETVKECSQICISMQDSVQKKVMNTVKRTAFMSVNLQDYLEYISLPIEERSELLKLCAAVLGTEKSNFKQAVHDLDEKRRMQHVELLKYCDNNIQTLYSVENKLKDFYNKDLQECNKPQNKIKPEVFENIQRTLDTMCNEIQDTINACNSFQDGESVEENTEVQKMLKEIMETNKK